MKGPLVLILVAIFVVAILLLAFWQFGILRQKKLETVSESERKAEAILQFLESFDFAGDFKKIREKLPAGVVKVPLPLATSELGVFDPFGLSTITPPLRRSTTSE